MVIIGCGLVGRIRKACDQLAPQKQSQNIKLKPTHIISLSGVMVQSDYEDLQCCVNQRFCTVREQQMIVRHPHAHRIVGTHCVQQRSEHRQRMAVLCRRQVLDPPVWCCVQICKLTGRKVLQSLDRMRNIPVQ